MGIDEHFFTQKKGFATTFCDLRKGSVYDVTLGRSESSLSHYLSRLHGKEKVRVVVIDLSETYRSISRKYFPNAKIVADRFHVIRLINQRFMETWKQLDSEGRKNRGLTSLMRRHQWRLKPGQVANLQRYLDSVPGLSSVYHFKQRLCRLLTLKHRTAKQCRKLIPRFVNAINQLKASGFDSLISLGKTLERWNNEIARMWRFTKTNSITEGFHNKMEQISRRAYGFRNFENYRLRVKLYCG